MQQASPCHTQGGFHSGSLATSLIRKTAMWWFLGLFLVCFQFPLISDVIRNERGIRRKQSRLEPIKSREAVKQMNFCFRSCWILWPMGVTYFVASRGLETCGQGSRDGESLCR